MITYFVGVKYINRNIRLINSAKAEDAIAVIDVLGEIGFDWWTGEGFTKDSVLAEFKGKKLEEVHFNISSLGGDYFEALGIKNMAIQTGATIKVHYFGMVASAATEIGNAATKENTTMASDAFILIHNTSTWAGGNKEEILKTYETLAKFDEGLAKNYAAKSGKKTTEEFAAQMSKDQWMNADEALAWGLIGATTAAQPLSASSKSKVYACADKLKISVPDNFQNNKENDMSKSAKSVIAEFFAGIKAAGLKLVSDNEKEKPEDTNKKVKDLTDLFIKNVEEATTAEEPTTVTNLVADYEATVSDEVSSVELADDTVVDMPNYPYAVSEEGATALQTDMAAVITDGTVSVTYDSETTSLTISVTGTATELKSVNATVDFTKSNEQEETEEGDSATENTVENLKKKVAENNKKIQTAKNEKSNTDNEKSEIDKLKKTIANQEAELKRIKAGKSGGKSAGNNPGPKGKEEEVKSEGEEFVAGMFNKYVKSR